MPDEQSTDTKAARASYDASVRFVGLVHALQASAETALGDDTSPLRNARRQGLEGVKAARRSLGLLEMLQEKTLGNLDESEREELWHALRGVRAALEEGLPIAIMPEGTLTRDPDLWPMKARPGVGRLALSSGAPVIPIAQWGAQGLLGRYARRPGNIFRRPVQHVQAGPPVDLSDLLDRPDDPRAHTEATRRVMAAITTMLADIRGEEPPAEPFDMAKHKRASS